MGTPLKTSSQPSLAQRARLELLANSPNRATEELCKFACNNDPLRGDFRVQFRPPLTLCVSVLPFGPDRPGRADGDGWGGQDRGDTARLFRARPLDQGDRAHAFGVAR